MFYLFDVKEVAGILTMSTSDVLYSLTDMLFLSFYSFQDDPMVLQEAIAILACFATELEVIRHQCAVEKLHIPVLQSLQTFKDNVTLIEMAFELIGNVTCSTNIKLSLFNRI